MSTRLNGIHAHIWGSTTVIAALSPVLQDGEIAVITDSIASSTIQLAVGLSGSIYTVGGSVSGSGTTNHLARWSSSLVLADSLITDDGSSIDMTATIGTLPSTSPGTISATAGRGANASGSTAAQAGASLTISPGRGGNASTTAGGTSARGGNISVVGSQGGNASTANAASRGSHAYLRGGLGGVGAVGYPSGDGGDVIIAGGQRGSNPTGGTFGTSGKVRVGNDSTLTTAVNIMSEAGAGGAVNIGISGVTTTFAGAVDFTGATVTGITVVGLALTSAKIWVGDGSNTAQEVAVSGVITLSNAGVTAFHASAFGTSSSTACVGNDSRLSDARTPVGTALTSTQIWVGSSGNVAAAVAMSGDATLSNTGALTLATVATAGTYGQVTIDAKGRATAGATCDVSHGGTGLTTLTAHSLYVGNGTSAPTALGSATNGQIPIGSTGADPVLAAIVGTGIVVTNGAGSITLTPPNVIILQDQQSSGTEGGTFTAGAWRTRTLNTEVVDTGGNCTLSSNQFTLDAGTYEIFAVAPGYQVERHVIRLQNVTDGTTTLSGVSANATSSSTTQTNSLINDRFVLASSKTFEIQHQCQATKASNGFGVAMGAVFTVAIEVYTSVFLRKVA